MIAGGPAGAWANWIIVGGTSILIAYCLAEICSTMPTAGGIYFWSGKLGGPKYGPFLAWITAYWSMAGWIITCPASSQGLTALILSAVQINYPDYDTSDPRVNFGMTVASLVVICIPNIISTRFMTHFFRFAAAINLIMFVISFIWLPVNAPSFQSASFVFTNFQNQLNDTDVMQGSDASAWFVGMLFAAYTFYGYDASAHVAEETKDSHNASAKGIVGSVGWSAFLSFPLLLVYLFCIQDLDALINSPYPQTVTELYVQALGEQGAVGFLCLLYISGTVANVACMTSASRVIYAISRDGLLPFSHLWRKTNKGKMPVNAVYLALVLSIILSCSILGSSVAFTALTATATIAINVSYGIPIAARVFVQGRNFKQAEYSLGRYSRPIGFAMVIWIAFLFVVFCLPQRYPVTSQTLNYAPVMIGAISLLSIVAWVLPVIGGMHWYHGPVSTYSADQIAAIEAHHDQRKGLNLENVVVENVE